MINRNMPLFLKGYGKGWNAIYIWKYARGGPAYHYPDLEGDLEGHPYLIKYLFNV